MKDLEEAQRALSIIEASTYLRIVSSPAPPNERCMAVAGAEAAIGYFAQDGQRFEMLHQTLRQFFVSQVDIYGARLAALGVQT
jgi:hypothetical protein